jgi:hypothetical protein
MAQLTLIKHGPRSFRLEVDDVKEQDTNAVYNISGCAYVETYDDVEYVTSVGIYGRQDNATDCKAARASHDLKEREIKEAVQEVTRKSSESKTPVATE